MSTGISTRKRSDVDLRTPGDPCAVRPRSGTVPVTSPPGESLWGLGRNVGGFVPQVNSRSHLSPGLNPLRAVREVVPDTAPGGPSDVGWHIGVGPNPSAKDQPRPKSRTYGSAQDPVTFDARSALPGNDSTTPTSRSVPFQRTEDFGLTTPAGWTTAPATRTPTGPPPALGTPVRSAPT